jgi:hypothetical protein
VRRDEGRITGLTTSLRFSVMRLLQLKIKPERRCTPTYRQYTHDHLNFLC